MFQIVGMDSLPTVIRPKGPLKATSEDKLEFSKLFDKNSDDDSDDDQIRQVIFRHSVHYLFIYLFIFFFYL